jgi:4-diphosphocytidyl-2-C-methyl-D-erythritol kinase
MRIEKSSPCKVNLLLNILGQRPDGFHELETLMHPIMVCDQLTFHRAGQGITLSCSEPSLPTDARNLVYRAADHFRQAAGLTDGVAIHLEKRLPLAGGIGGGSANAAVTLLGLNELLGQPLPPERLHALAASLGSDVPFFLQTRPALATGRGEQIEPLDLFPALRGLWFVLVHPGFGISTPWAYQQLARFPNARDGVRGRARQLAERLTAGDLLAATAGFYNALEAPAFEKYPLLFLFKEFLLEAGAATALMSGSGSTTFALVNGQAAAEAMVEQFKRRFGDTHWFALAPAPG